MNFQEHGNTKNNCAIKQVPPHCHQRNGAEVTIIEFKQHFLSIIVGVAKYFPMHQWERLLPQAELTLNLLQQSHTNTTPTLSDNAEMFGTCNYNKIPVGPMGCSVLVHENTNACATWDNHAVYIWYFQTSQYHYRAHVYCIKKTKAETCWTH